MRNSVTLATIVAGLAVYGSCDADLRDKISNGVSRAKSSASSSISRHRETIKSRAQESLDNTRQRVQESTNRTRSKIQDSYDDARSKTEDYYHGNVEAKVEEERRRFEADPIGYSSDLGRRINEGKIRFEDAASDGIAQGFVDIEYQKGKRLGDLIETKTGIREDHTKKGVKIGVLYLMGSNPAYFIRELPIVEDDNGNLMTIEQAKARPSLRPSAVRLENYVYRMAEGYKDGRIRDTANNLSGFREEMRTLNIRREDSFIESMYGSAMRELNSFAIKNGNSNIGEYIFINFVIKPIEYAVKAFDFVFKVLDKIDKRS